MSSIEPVKYGLYDSYDDHIAAGQLCLTYMIQHMVYANLIAAQRGNWRLGRLHADWELLSKYPRVRILGPRDHLKSFFWAICYPILRMWREPGINIMIISGTDRLAMSKLDYIKKIIEATPEFTYLRQNAETWGKQEVVLSNKSRVYVQGYDVKMRGEHPQIIILDDPIDTKVVYSQLQNDRSVERFFAEVLPMAEPTTQIIIIGTVQREDDLYMSLDPSTWVLRTYSAIVDEVNKITLCPELWDWGALERRKSEIIYKHGDRFWRKEYLNDPKALVGQVFQEGWFRYYENKPQSLTIYIGCDPSVGQTVGSDYTAIAVVGINSDNVFYVLDIERGRWTLPDRLRVLERLCNMYSPRIVGIESVAFSFDTVQQAIQTFRWPVTEIKCTGTKASKMARAEALSIYFRNEKMYFPCKGYDLNGLPILDSNFLELRDELIGFPGRFDDQVDALHIASMLASREGWQPILTNPSTEWTDMLKSGRRKNLIHARGF